MLSTADPQERLNPVFHLLDLSSLSVSSVAPIFSVAAAGGAMVAAAGAAVPLAIVLIAIPFMLCSWIFLSLNQHFPNAGASYHWSRRIVGVSYSNFQAWIVIMAYFWSIPPILIPAAQFTLSALGNAHPSTLLQILVALLWAAFAGSVLLLGATITARITQIFLIVEVASVVAMAILGYAHWTQFSGISVRFSFDHIRWSGVIICMVIAATLVDGWEIDSYASEEATKPRLTPGWGGIIGAGAVVAYYLVIWPILLHEVPLSALRTSSDVLATWSRAAAPGFLLWLRLAIIASTAGSLWLTTFILSRALFSMSRDRILPAWLGRLTRRRVPFWSTFLPIALAMGVILLQLLLPSVRSFFAVVLSAAGFFLVAEFFLDGLNMLVFLVRHHHAIRHGLKFHHHSLLLAGALLVVLSLGTLEIFFVRYGPQYLGARIDWVTGGMVLLGALYVVYLRSRRRSQRTVSPFIDPSGSESSGPKAGASG